MKRNQVINIGMYLSHGEITGMRCVECLIMCTTNMIESLNNAFRKFTVIRTVFPTDEILFKSLYLAQN
jgi:Transposase and inactivated derivatives